MHLDLPSPSPKLSEPFARAQGSRTARVQTLPPHNRTHAPSPLTSGTPVAPASEPAPGRGAQAWQD